MSHSDQTSYDLDQLPEASTLRSVTAAPAFIAGRRALRVELTDAVTYDGRPKVDYVDMPTFVILPAIFMNGTIDVDILSRLNGKGPADARAFAGVAYRITDGGDHCAPQDQRFWRGVEPRNQPPLGGQRRRRAGHHDDGNGPFRAPRLELQPVDDEEADASERRRLGDRGPFDPERLRPRERETLALARMEPPVSGAAELARNAVDCLPDGALAERLAQVSAVSAA